MDGRNKITQDMLQPKVDRSLSDEEGSSDYLFEFSDNDSDGSDIRYTERTTLTLTLVLLFWTLMAVG